MYYSGKILKFTSEFLQKGGKLRWLFDFVKSNPELDLIIEKRNSKECISVYRGSSRFISITQYSKDKNLIKVNGTAKCKNIIPKLYGKKSIFDNFIKELEYLLSEYPKSLKYYYLGIYHNILTRKYGIDVNKKDGFVIIDRNPTLVYEQEEKNNLIKTVVSKYKQLEKDILSLNVGVLKKSIENKLVDKKIDYLGLDKEGNILLILLIPYTFGNNTSKIYRSPLQLGMYYDIFSKLYKKQLGKTIFDILAQKQKIGLINPDWQKPNSIKNIIPVLIIYNYNYKSSAKRTLKEILYFSRKQLGSNFLKNLKTYNIETSGGLNKWPIQ